MNDISESDRFAPREDLVLEEIEDEVVILDLKSNSYFGLNPVARLVWQQLEAERSVGDIVDEIASHFEVERQQVSEDVLDFLGQALSAGLVTPQ